MTRLFYDMATTLCPQCLKRLPGKIFVEGERVYLERNCPDHGFCRALISSEFSYYKRTRDYQRPSQSPLQRNTETRKGCPYDCGICPDHEQHTCLAVVEITESCNLACPTCYADSSPAKKGMHRSVQDIRKMMEVLVANEGHPDIVQVSGGEPTEHPEFWAIVDLIRSYPVKHLMLNTNGLRLARDPDFARRLSDLQPGFEVYLQFDSLNETPLRVLRGMDLRQIRGRALEHLQEFSVSTNLVATLRRGLNDNEVGDLINFAKDIGCVRGITFQPTQAAGRLQNFDRTQERLTLSDVRRAIIDQSSIFKEDDVIPVPCHPEGIAMAYGIKTQNGLQPLSQWVNPESLITTAGNTIVLEQDLDLRQRLGRIFSTSTSVEQISGDLKSLLCCLPLVDGGELTYKDIFRVVVMQFFDAYNFDLRPIKKTCVHIPVPDGRIIPFDTMNILYRTNSSISHP